MSVHTIPGSEKPQRWWLRVNAVMCDAHGMSRFRRG
jgi:hypothetical protein